MKTTEAKLMITSFDCYLLGQFYLSPQGAILEYIQSLAKSALNAGPSDYGVDYFIFINWALSLGLISADDSYFRIKLKDWVYDYTKDIEEFIPISNLVSVVDSPTSGADH